MRKKICLILSVFFAFDPNIGAAPKIEEESLEVTLSGNDDQSSADAIVSPLVGLVPKKAPNPFQKMKFEIILEAHKRLLSTYKLHCIETETISTNSFSDNALKRATYDMKIALYASLENIREWQILKTVLDIIEEKMNLGSGEKYSLRDLITFKDLSSKDLKRAITGRKVFLKSALEVAAELKTWNVLYERHKSRLDVENIEASENIQAMLNKNAMITQCENLYQLKDSMDALWGKALNECRVFVQEIKDLLEPCIIPIEDDLFTLQHAQKESFLEEKKSAFENSEDIRAKFNVEDGNIFLETLAEMLRVCNANGEKLEAMMKFQAAVAAGQIVIAQERAAREVAEHATEIIKINTEAEKRDLQSRKDVAEAEIKKMQKAAAEIMKTLEIDAYAECLTIKELFHLYNLPLPSPSSLWNCKQIASEFQNYTMDTIKILSDQYHVAESILVKQKPLHPWLKLDLKIKSIQSFEANVLPNVKPELARSYHLLSQEAINNTLKKIENHRADFSDIFQEQISLMLRHAFIKRLIDEYTKIFSLKGSNMRPPSERFSLKDGSLYPVRFYNSWTDYLDKGVITQETMSRALSKLSEWESDLNHPLNHQMVNILDVLGAAWSDISNPEQEKKCIYIGRSVDDNVTVEYQPDGAGAFFRKELLHYFHQVVDSRSLSLRLSSLISYEGGLSTTPNNGNNGSLLVAGSSGALLLGDKVSEQQSSQVSSLPRYKDTAHSSVQAQEKENQGFFILNGTRIFLGGVFCSVLGLMKLYKTETPIPVEGVKEELDLAERPISG